MSEYMIVLLVSGIIPLILSFYPPLGFYRRPRALSLSIVVVTVAFGGWDVVATWRGHWRFHPAKVFPVRIINLPLEEVLFFIVITFCCIFTWEVVKFFRYKRT